MFIGIVFLFCVLSVPLAGGRLSALADVRLRCVWAIAAAFAAQFLIISVIGDLSAVVQRGVHLSTYGLAGWFVWVNRGVPGLLLAGIGGSLNAAAIVANGGVMPASAAALATAGMDEQVRGFTNSTTVANARLGFLGDIFAVPGSWPIHNVFSIGDVVLVAAALIGLHIIGASRLARLLGDRHAARRAPHDRHAARRAAGDA